MTSEQYTGVLPRQINALSVSRDTLNPLLNTNILKQRLSAIDYYKQLHGPRIARWPHFWMHATAQKLWKYKFNLAVKGFAAYVVYREVQHYRNLNEKTILTIDQSLSSFGSIAASSGFFLTLCCLI